MSRILMLVFLSAVVVAGGWWLAGYEPTPPVHVSGAAIAEPPLPTSEQMVLDDSLSKKLPLRLKERVGMNASSGGTVSKRAPAKQGSSQPAGQPAIGADPASPLSGDTSASAHVAAAAQPRDTAEESGEELQTLEQERRDAAERQAVMKIYSDTLTILREGSDGNQ